LDENLEGEMRIFLFISFLFATKVISAQVDTLGKKHLIVSGLMGSIVPHRAEMTPLIQGYSYAGSIQWMKRPTMPKWRIYQRFPMTGYDLYFSTTGNPRQLGQQLALSYMIYRPYGKHRKCWYGMGLGVGYSSKIWDLDNNHQAPVISTRLNCALSLHFQYALFSTLSKEHLIGLRMTHMSNGAYQLPNLGTNQFQLSYTIKPRMELPKGPMWITDELPVYHSSRWISLHVAAGLKEIYQPLGRKYPVYNLQLNYARMMNYRHRWSVGMDYLYQPGLEKLFEMNSNQSSSPKNWQQWGATLGYQSIFGFTTFAIQQGVYLKTDWKNNGPFYQRLSIRRNCMKLAKINSYFNRVYITAALFTHWAKADHFEFGCGIDLFRR
jgi:hypothetical protein